ncbi:hypothetical protein M514_24669 [Trichuris suis]|uniref:Mos1 transposase HTH domain-containing protein n=1 Tax=Trichuris suis TaxID=68888 RepID=A0A085N148_9BILA|nr:hypothetical protein M514_24669 [Trichuris suis]
MGMDEKLRHAILLYEFKSRRSISEAVRNINAAFGPGSVSKSTAGYWFRKFASGCESLEDSPRTGRPSSIDNQALKELVESDPTQTQDEMALKLGQLGKVKKLYKWVPHELSDQQMFRRLEVCSSLLRRNETDPFLDRIVTVDEKWVLYDNRRRSWQWLDSDEPPRKFPKPPVHLRKTMLIVFWSHFGIIHFKFLKAGQPITADNYCHLLEAVMEKLLEKRTAFANRRRVILLQDNARPHAPRKTLQKISELGMEPLPHPPYSPDLSPTDYHIFKHLEHHLRGKIFGNPTDLENDILQKQQDSKKRYPIYLGAILLYERCAKQKNVKFYFTDMKKQCEDDEELPSAPHRTSVRP